MSAMGQRSHRANNNTKDAVGSSNFVVQGGVCIRHGAKVKKCSHVGCLNYPQRGGVCIRHGEKLTDQKCSHNAPNNVVALG